MIGIAHGEESVDRAVLVAVHRVDDRMPIENDTLVVSTNDTKWMGNAEVYAFKAHRIVAS